MNEQQIFKILSEPTPEPELHNMDQAVLDAADHGFDFESMRQWQIDREIASG